MKALIIGGGGFVGSYLARQLVQGCHWDTTVTKLPQEDVSVEGCEAYNLDILDQDAVEALLVRLRPDVISIWQPRALWRFPGKIPRKPWRSTSAAV